jgi:polyhydroxyalkanoate synthesis regulator phasin
MSDIIKKVFLAGLGAATLTREKAEEIIEDLVKKGELKREEKPGVLDDLLKATEKRKDEMQNFVKEEVQKVLKTLNITTKEDIDSLEKRLKNHIKQKHDADKK